MLSLTESYRILGIPPQATAWHITMAFRRLARELHPDINPDPAARQRFVAVLEAYALLREARRARPADADWDCCPRCGRYDDLLDGLDGGKACAACLLGRRQRARLLPLPVVVLARHLLVIGLYAAALAFIWTYAHTWHLPHAMAGLASALAGLLLLATQVLTIVRQNPRAAARSRPCGVAAAGQPDRSARHGSTANRESSPA